MLLLIFLLPAIYLHFVAAWSCIHAAWKFWVENFRQTFAVFVEISSSIGQNNRVNNIPKQKSSSLQIRIVLRLIYSGFTIWMFASIVWVTSTPRCVRDTFMPHSCTENIPQSPANVGKFCQHYVWGIKVMQRQKTNSFLLFLQEQYLYKSLHHYKLRLYWC